MGFFVTSMGWYASVRLVDAWCRLHLMKAWAGWDVWGWVQGLCFGEVCWAQVVLEAVGYEVSGVFPCSETRLSSLVKPLW